MVCFAQCDRAVGVMERHFSVDDIVGTLWNSGGELSNEAGNGDEDEYNSKGLNRSASEWAFQEFIKHNFQIPSRSDALTYGSSDSEPENDEDFSHTPVPDKAENDDARAQKDVSKLSPRSGAKPKHEDASTGSTAAPKVDDHVDSTPAKPKATSEKPSFKEPEIKAALNPLFSGLHSEMTAAGRDPQEINTYYQEKLAEACLRARKAREGVLGLPESGQDHSVVHLPANKPPSGAEGANIRPSGGGILPEIPSKPVTSGSSQDQSDDEEIDNEQNLEPGDKKRVKRMLSNRESARRSRRRKQAHLNELESQVAQLRVQNSSLAESLQSTSQKLKDASKDNLQLKTYVEMLKAKLLAATTLHRQLSMANSNVHVRAPLGTQEMPPVSRSFGWESGVHAMQPPRSNPYLMHPPMTSAAMAQMNNQHLELEQQSISMTVQQGMKMSRTPSMQRVGSMDHMKKKFRNAGASCSPTSWAATSMVDLDGPSTMIPQFTLSSEY